MDNMIQSKVRKKLNELIAEIERLKQAHTELTKTLKELESSKEDNRVRDPKSLDIYMKDF